jgi:hypothetical protein
MSSEEIFRERRRPRKGDEESVWLTQFWMEDQERKKKLREGQYIVKSR